MEVTKELIAKFFRQECTPGERQLVSDYFELHPDELDQFIGDDDWQNFETGTELHPAVSQQMLQHIEENIATKPRIRKSGYKVWLAAASVIFIAGACLFFMKKTNSNTQRTTDQVATLASAIPADDTVINKTGREMSVTLPDGSLVLLSAKSRFAYNKAFTQKRRDIYLSGEAVFKVAKDKTRPFTVYASGLSTTALGTCFRVSAFSNDSQVLVKLYEGKVVIKHLEAAMSMPDSDIYLTPGHELRWNNTVKKGRVIAFNNTQLPAMLPPKASDVKLAVTFVKFNNERLATVIDELEKMYNIRISVTGRNLDNKFYTGTVNSRKESADDILHTIALLNRFGLKKQGDIYVLSPQAGAPADSVARSKRDE